MPTEEGLQAGKLEQEDEEEEDGHHVEKHLALVGQPPVGLLEGGGQLDEPADAVVRAHRLGGHRPLAVVPTADQPGRVVDAAGQVGGVRLQGQHLGAALRPEVAVDGQAVDEVAEGAGRRPQHARPQRAPVDGAGAVLAQPVVDTGRAEEVVAVGGDRVGQDAGADDADQLLGDGPLELLGVVAHRGVKVKVVMVMVVKVVIVVMVVMKRIVTNVVDEVFGTATPLKTCCR